MEKMSIFAMSSFIHKRTDVRLFQQIGIFYACMLQICGTVTPCRSSNARQLVYSSTTGSAVPFFLLPHTTSNCFNICRKCTTMAGRYIVVPFPARKAQFTRCSLPIPPSSGTRLSSHAAAGSSRPRYSFQTRPTVSSMPVRFPGSQPGSMPSLQNGRHRNASANTEDTRTFLNATMQCARRTACSHPTMQPSRICSFTGPEN